MTESLKESVYKVVRIVATPLRFFAVALILLTVLIVSLAWKSSLPAEMTTNIIIVAFIALIILLFIVTFLVIFFPKKLTFDQEAHLTLLREQLGDNELPRLYFAGELPSVQPPKLITAPSKKGGKK